MNKSNVVELSGREGRDELTELIRTGARKLIAQALEAEVLELLSSFSGERDAQGRAAVVRNGYQPEREIQTGIGPVTVKMTGEVDHKGLSDRISADFKDGSLKTAVFTLVVSTVSSI